MKIRRLVIRTVCLFGLWLGVGLQAQAQTDTVTYVYTDPQGTPLVEADASGNVIAKYDYTPYGSSIASLGAAPSGPGYTGHVNDPETGLVYMQARYYQPIGRFLSPDPMGPSAGNMYSFNRYVYVENNPIMHIDPDGRQTDDASDTLSYKTGVPPANGQLAAMLTCTQQCSGQQLTVTSTHEVIPQHSATDPHRLGEAADLRVQPGTEDQVLQCAANCGARFGLNERTHPSAHATAPHVHVQIVPGTHGGRGDLPQPQQNNQPNTQPGQPQQPQSPQTTQPAPQSTHQLPQEN